MKKVSALTGLVVATLAVPAVAHPSEGQIKHDEQKNGQAFVDPNEEELDFFKIVIQSLGRVISPDITIQSGMNCALCDCL